MEDDFVRPIVQLLGNGGEPEQVRQLLHESFRSIDEKIASLRQQEAIIRQLVAYFEPSALLNTVQSPVKAAIRADGLQASDRSRLVRQAALQLAGEGRNFITSGEVIAKLQSQGITFSVKRPASMAATVITSMEEFQRTSQDNFLFKGQEEA